VNDALSRLKYLREACAQNTDLLLPIDVAASILREVYEKLGEL